MTDYNQARDRNSRKGLTAEILRTLVRYVPETGEFIRIAAPTRSAGKLLNKPAKAYINDNGYALISLGRVWRFRAHQLAWLYMTGEWPSGDIDHKNDIRHDNRWENLRAATRSQNIGNARIPHDSLSGVKGATWDKNRGKWLSQIVFQGRHIYLGRFDTKEEAGAAYDRAALKYFGEFARAA
jgi:hypothetical protein